MVLTVSHLETNIQDNGSMTYEMAKELKKTKMEGHMQARCPLDLHEVKK